MKVIKQTNKYIDFDEIYLYKPEKIKDSNLKAYFIEIDNNGIKEQVSKEIYEDLKKKFIPNNL